PTILVLPAVCAVVSSPATTTLCPRSLHDALPISRSNSAQRSASPRCSSRSSNWFAVIIPPPGWQSISVSVSVPSRPVGAGTSARSEEHTSELQSRFDLVCRLLLEKKNPREPADPP